MKFAKVMPTILGGALCSLPYPLLPQRRLIHPFRLRPLMPPRRVSFEQQSGRNDL